MTASKADTIGFCDYCKLEIYCGETYISKNGRLYHAEENEVHDNCFKLVFECEN